MRRRKRGPEGGREGEKEGGREEMHLKNKVLFMCLLAICMSSLRNVYLGLLHIFQLGCLFIYFFIELYELLIYFGN